MNQKDILIIAITIFLTVIAWVVLELYGIKKETPTNTQIESTTLKYTIDTDILDALEKRTP